MLQTISRKASYNREFQYEVRQVLSCVKQAKDRVLRAQLHYATLNNRDLLERIAIQFESRNYTELNTEERNICELLLRNEYLTMMDNGCIIRVINVSIDRPYVD